MIVDFHIHYAPEKLVKARLGNESFKLMYSNGIPSYSFHPGLYRTDRHVEAMDLAGVDRATPPSARHRGGQPGPLQDDQRRPGALGKAVSFEDQGAGPHPPLGGSDAFGELRRATGGLGFDGVAMASIVEGRESRFGGPLPLLRVG